MNNEKNLQEHLCLTNKRLVKLETNTQVEDNLQKCLKYPFRFTGKKVFLIELGYSLVSPFMVTLIIVCSITIPSTGLYIYTAARFFGQPCVSQFIFPKRIIVFRPTTYS